MMGVGGAREAGRNDNYCFTFSPLFQIDYQLCLRSTIYNTDQTWSCSDLDQTASFHSGGTDLLSLGGL